MELKHASMLCFVCVSLLSTGYFILKRDGISPCVPAWADSIPATGLLAQYAPAPQSYSLEIGSPSYFRVMRLVSVIALVMAPYEFADRAPPGMHTLAQSR